MFYVRTHETAAWCAARRPQREEHLKERDSASRRASVTKGVGHTPCHCAGTRKNRGYACCELPDDHATSGGSTALASGAGQPQMANGPLVPSQRFGLTRPTSFGLIQPARRRLRSGAGVRGRRFPGGAAGTAAITTRPGAFLRPPGEEGIHGRCRRRREYVGVAHVAAGGSRRHDVSMLNRGGR